MPHSSFFELISIICLIVETNDCSDSHFLEDGDIVFGSKIGALDKMKITPRSSFCLS